MHVEKVSMNIQQFWADVLSQSSERLHSYFHKDAVVRWHCTNELFTAQEFIQANCTYPGQWNGTIERIETCTDLIITVVNVYPARLTGTADATKLTVTTRTPDMSELSQHATNYTEGSAIVGPAESPINSFHVVSFIKLKNDLIIEMDEYWADDSEAPKWRQAMHIGKAIK